MIKPFNDQCSHHIETSQLIFANQLTGFYMMGTLVVKRLKYNEAQPNTMNVIDGLLLSLW